MTQFNLVEAFATIQLNVLGAAMGIGAGAPEAQTFSQLDMAIANLMSIKMFITEQIMADKNHTKEPIPQGTEIPKNNQGVKPSKPTGKAVEPSGKKSKK